MRLRIGLALLLGGLVPALVTTWGHPDGGRHSDTLASSTHSITLGSAPRERPPAMPVLVPPAVAAGGVGASTLVPLVTLTLHPGPEVAAITTRASVESLTPASAVVVDSPLASTLASGGTLVVLFTSLSLTGTLTLLGGGLLAAEFTSALVALLTSPAELGVLFAGTALIALLTTHLIGAFTGLGLSRPLLGTPLGGLLRITLSTSTSLGATFGSLVGTFPVVLNSTLTGAGLVDTLTVLVGTLTLLGRLLLALKLSSTLLRGTLLRHLALSVLLTGTGLRRALTTDLLLPLAGDQLGADLLARALGSGLGGLLCLDTVLGNRLTTALLLALLNDGLILTLLGLVAGFLRAELTSLSLGRPLTCSITLGLALTRKCLLLTLLAEARLGGPLLTDSTGPSLGGRFPLPLSEELTGTGLIGTLTLLGVLLLGLHLSSLLLQTTLTSQRTLGFLLAGHGLRLTLTSHLGPALAGNGLSLTLRTPVSLRLALRTTSLGSLHGHFLRSRSLLPASSESLRLGKLLSSLLLELLLLGRKLTGTGLIGTLLALGSLLAGLLLHATLLLELSTALGCDSLGLGELSSTLSSLLRRLGRLATSLTGTLNVV